MKLITFLRLIIASITLCAFVYILSTATKRSDIRALDRLIADSSISHANAAKIIYLYGKE